MLSTGFINMASKRHLVPARFRAHLRHGTRSDLWTASCTAVMTERWLARAGAANEAADATGSLHI
jgi:hypothetical protein